jgi:hypothetical protein
MAQHKEFLFKVSSSLCTDLMEQGINIQPENLEVNAVDFFDSTFMQIKIKKEEVCMNGIKISNVLSTFFLYKDNNEEVQPNPGRGLKKGCNFFPFLVKNLYTTEDILIDHQPGEVLILTFWNINNDSCRSSMQKNLEMIKKNETLWKGGKVRFIAISDSQESEEVIDFIEDNGWNIYPGILNHFESIKFLDFSGLYGTNNFVVINQNGVIDYLQMGGHPIENPINKLLEYGCIIVENLNNEQQLLNDFLGYCKMFHSKFLTNLEYNPGFDYIYYTNGKFIQDGSDIEFSQLSDLKFSAYLRKNEFFLWNEMLKKNFPPEIICKLQNIITIQEIETFDIEKNYNCHKCQQTFIEKDGEYYCYWCKISYCVYCTESLRHETGLGKYVHPEHNLLYFMHNISEDKLKYLDKFRIGNNLFKDVKEEELQESHHAFCNICSSNISSERFLCVSCNPGFLIGYGFNDFCVSCVNILRSKDHDDYEYFKNICVEHDHEKHVYLRLIHEAKNYLEY